MSTQSNNVKPRERHSESCKSLSVITRTMRVSRIETSIKYTSDLREAGLKKRSDD